MARRKHSAWHYAKSITAQVWRHPSNRGRRIRALAGAVAWQARKRLSASPRDVPFFGWKLRCYPDSNSASNVIYFTERYDPDELGFLAAFLRPGDGFVDVGANIGTYSLLAARLVGASGRIDAFEPDPVAAGRLRENLDINRIESVTVHELAIAEREGCVDFLVGQDVSNRIRTAVDEGRPSRLVAVRRLDEVLAGRSCVMAKLDVEGRETAALRGAPERLRRADPPVWQLEVIDHLLDKAGSSRGELLGLLTAAGFRLARFRAEDCALQLVGLGAAGENVWAIHETALAMVQSRIAERRVAREASG